MSSINISTTRSLRWLLPALLTACGTATAATVNYTIDPSHTFPSFEADHFGGLSTWRGKFNHTRGTVSMDRAAGTGQVNIIVDMRSADFGLDSLNKIAQGPQLFDTSKYPIATYTGTLAGFVDGVPTRVNGKLTLHGVTRPLMLKINSFKCVPDPDPRYKRERCGADALATFNRDDYDMSAGKDYGFRMGVTLRIQVEAVRAP